MDLLTFKIILVVALFAVSLGVAAYSTWGERKLQLCFKTELVQTELDHSVFFNH
jgi:hypothetical protein